MTTTVVNLWAGSGCGKSTVAAAVFAALKTEGASVELVTEYVKTWAWRGDAIGEFDEVLPGGERVELTNGRKRVEAA